MSRGDNSARPRHAGFTILSHTADTGLRVYGKDAGELLQNLVRGLMVLLGVPAGGGAEKESFVLACSDAQLFYSGVANEIIYRVMTKKFAPSAVIASFSGDSCRVTLYGEYREPGAACREVKAAVLHDLREIPVEDGLLLEIYFDV